MKLHEFLEIVDKDEFIYIGIAFCGMQFETRHSVEFFIGKADELNNKKIKKVYVTDGELHVRLED